MLSPIYGIEFLLLWILAYVVELIVINSRKIVAKSSKQLVGWMMFVLFSSAFIAIGIVFLIRPLTQSIFNVQ